MKLFRTKIDKICWGTCDASYPNWHLLKPKTVIYWTWTSKQYHIGAGNFPVGRNRKYSTLLSLVFLENWGCCRLTLNFPQFHASNSSSSAIFAVANATSTSDMTCSWCRMMQKSDPFCREYPLSWVQEAFGERLCSPSFNLQRRKHSWRQLICTTRSILTTSDNIKAWRLGVSSKFLKP